MLNKSMQYRPDIEGLRALAVLIVIFNHINLSGFSGGFIGVDVFFVISGFLITKIIYQDIKAQKFSFGDFYKKRIIRLAPAFFTILITVSVLSFFIMLPNELVEYAKSLIYSTFLLANVFMRKEAGDYFSGSVDEVPLLHLWSLAIEEQFYLIWPLLLVLIIKKEYTKHLLWIVITMIALSLFYAEQQLFKSASKAYYRMPVRACELLIGALICFLPIIKINKVITNALIFISLAVIFFCSFHYSYITAFPGLTAIVPCIATSTIIYLGQSTEKYSYFLSNPVATWLGKISYPMYLWHWPIVVLFNFYYLEFNWQNQILIITITILISYLTYKLIEIPARKWRLKSNRTVFIKGFLVPSLIMTSIASCTIISQGLPQRFPDFVSKQISALQADSHRIRKQCHDAPQDESELPSQSTCYIGVKKDNVDFIVIGDSHANSMIGAINIWAKDANLRGFDPTHTANMYMPDVDRYYASDRKNYQLRSEYKIRNDAITEHLKQNRYDFVIFAGYYSLYLDTMFDIRDGVNNSRKIVLKQGLLRALKNISLSTDKIYIVLDVPELRSVKANCPVRITTLKLKQSCSIPLDDVKERDSITTHILNELGQDFPQIRFIDPKKVMCDQSSCSLSLNDVPLYVDKDKDHLNYLGSQEIGKVYNERFGNPFLQK